MLRTGFGFRIAFRRFPLPGYLKGGGLNPANARILIMLVTENMLLRTMNEGRSHVTQLALRLPLLSRFDK
jgi:hypothetical protein